MRMRARLLPVLGALLAGSASPTGAQRPSVHIDVGCADSSDAAWFQSCRVMQRWQVKATPDSVIAGVLHALRLANFQQVQRDSADGGYRVIADSMGVSPFAAIKPECENLEARNSTRAIWRVQREGSTGSTVELSVSNDKVRFVAAGSCPHVNLLPLIVTLRLGAEVDSTLAKR